MKYYYTLSKFFDNGKVHKHFISKKEAQKYIDED